MNDTPPFLDRALPRSWDGAQKYQAVLKAEARELGLTEQETELIKVRASQINECAFCVDLHSRQARQSGVIQQKLDMLPAWRESTKIFSEREAAVLAIAEAATKVPLNENSEADLYGAMQVLGEETFAAAEMIAVTINMFNRISILSHHPVRPRDAEGKVIR